MPDGAILVFQSVNLAGTKRALQKIDDPVGVLDQDEGRDGMKSVRNVMRHGILLFGIQPANAMRRQLFRPSSACVT